MIQALSLLFGFQLVGEVISRGVGTAVPGPVIGFGLLTALLVLRPDVMRIVEPTAMGILRHLSFLFVPAAVGVMQQVGRLRQEGLAIIVALVVSTWVAMAVTAVVFRLVSRQMGLGDDP
jgi:holin-like protein